ncbi:MAG: hypothetical protein WC291_10545 [Thermodesulfovibrionales bacterium]
MKKAFSIVCTITILAFGTASFALDRPAAVLGDVVGNGKAELKGGVGNWMSVEGRSFPVVDGASLRSGEGSASMVMRDRVKMQLGRDSEATVHGSVGAYSIMLAKGSLGFSVPRGISFTVTTPTSVVQVPTSAGPIQKVSHAAPDSVRGMVIFDGKGTKVVSVSGDLMVKDLSGTGHQLLAAGDSLYLDSRGASAVVPVQLNGGGENGDNGSNDTNALLTGGIMAGLTIGGFLAVDSGFNGGGGQPASPSVP